MKSPLSYFLVLALVLAGCTPTSPPAEEPASQPDEEELTMSRNEAAEGQRAYREYVVPLIFSLSRDDTSGDWSSRYRALPERPRQLVACAKAFADVPNGGFEQYFRNSYGDSARDAVSGFEWLGHSELGEAVSDAISLIGIDSVDDRQSRRHALEVLEKKGVDVDAHFQPATTRFLLGFDDGRELRVQLGLAALREGLWR